MILVQHFWSGVKKQTLLTQLPFYLIYAILNIQFAYEFVQAIGPDFERTPHFWRLGTAALVISILRVSQTLYELVWISCKHIKYPLLDFLSVM